jgi:hypothetical protein
MTSLILICFYERSIFMSDNLRGRNQKIFTPENQLNGGTHKKSVNYFD